MDWHEKEDAFCEVYRQGRQAANIWKYIPKKYYEAVENAAVDEDGYWVWLDYNGGWVAYDGGEDCGTIHEYNIADLKEAIKTIRKRKA